jgi:hypothetical protein
MFVFHHSRLRHPHLDDEYLLDPLFNKCKSKLVYHDPYKHATVAKQKNTARTGVLCQNKTSVKFYTLSADRFTLLAEIEDRYAEPFLEG